MDKKTARMRRAARTRFKLKELNQVRLCVHRTPKHMYAQIISGDGSTVLAAASTVEKAVKEDLAYSGNIASSQVVGKLIAERASEKGIKNVAFDRSGFKYHGRVKALADAARENGLEF
ncbi:MAG: 50S ribosomal protein L18 [Francisellaceae bacterium]